MRRHKAVHEQEKANSWVDAARDVLEETNHMKKEEFGEGIMEQHYLKKEEFIELVKC